jgi:Holliday junction resolvase RusA-like endonuclease
MYSPSKKYGLVKSKKYRAWIETNLPLIKEGLDKAEHFPIEIEIKVCGGRNFNNKNDIDNVVKPIVDLLVKAEILPDDSTQFVSECKTRYFHFSRGEVLTIISYVETLPSF